MLHSIFRRFFSKFNNKVNDSIIIHDKYKKNYINKLVTSNEIIYLNNGWNKIKIICEFTKKEKVCGDCECKDICGLKVSETRTFYKNE